MKRQQLMLEHRRHAFMNRRNSTSRRLTITAIHCFIVLKAATTAFDMYDTSISSKRPIQSSMTQRSYFSIVGSSLHYREQILKETNTNMRRAHRLEMTKNRVGLEQRRESATPTGVNELERV
jgi:hypothetical protein